MTCVLTKTLEVLDEKLKDLQQNIKDCNEEVKAAKKEMADIKRLLKELKPKKKDGGCIDIKRKNGFQKNIKMEKLVQVSESQKGLKM